MTREHDRGHLLVTDWDNLEIPVPWQIGRRVVEPPIAALAPYFAWTGAGSQLSALPSAAGLVARGVYGFWPANSIGDEIVIYKDDSRTKTLARLVMPRLAANVDGSATQSLADYIAPKASMAPDYIGAFAVTGGVGDDAARVAEALAEYVHAQARRDWGFGQADEVGGSYRGVRLVCGRDGLPVDSRAVLLHLLDSAAVGITETSTGSLDPAASQCGLIFSHPMSGRARAAMPLPPDPGRR